MTRSGFVLPVVALCASACGSAAVPAQEMSQAQAAIRAAEEVGAQQYPKAALHLKLARDGVSAAKQFAKEREQEAAVMALNEAEIDAELALAMARAEDMKKQARQTLAEIDELKKSAEAAGETEAREQGGGA